MDWELVEGRNEAGGILIRKEIKEGSPENLSNSVLAVLPLLYSECHFTGMAVILVITIAIILKSYSIVNFKYSSNYSSDHLPHYSHSMMIR